MTTSTWQTYRLGEKITLLSGGTPSKSNPKYWDGDIPWVSCKDMKGSRLHDSEDHLTQLGSRNGTRLVPEGTTLIVVRGMILAKHFPVAVTKRQVAFNQDLKAVQCHPGVHPQFIFYWLQGNAYNILGLADEAAHGTKRLQTDRLLNLPLALPPLPTQHNIASILSAYDDLIENNTRRIAILEEMAQALYREWFVHFRFPGHEQVRMMESELGPVPEGWGVKRLGELADVNATNIRRGHEPEVIQYVDIASVSPGQVDNIETMAFSEAPSRARRRVKDGDIIWSMVRPNRKSYSVILSPPPDMVVSTGFAVISAIAAPYTYIYHAVTTDDFVGYLTSRATGAAYPAVNAIDFENAAVLLPSNALLESFHVLVKNLFHLKHTLQQRNVNLRRTRDLLLPKLVSGEADVELVTTM